MVGPGGCAIDVVPPGLPGAETPPDRTIRWADGSPPGCFVPEKPDAYRDREIAVAASYHYEFQHNRTAVKVSIPNGMLNSAVEARGMDAHDLAVEIGQLVIDAALESKGR